MAQSYWIKMYQMGMYSFRSVFLNRFLISSVARKHLERVGLKTPEHEKFLWEQPVSQPAPEAILDNY